MTATSAGSCLTAKGLDISLAALKRQDPYINTIVDVASQVALYTYNNRSNEWEKTEVEGTLFIYTRLASPRHGFTIMNRLRMENLTEPITKDLDFQLQDPFLLYRNARLVIHGIWFYDKSDCQRIAQRMKILTHQEQVLAHSQGGWLLPGGGGGGGGSGSGGGGGGGGSEGKAVDIIQMLTKARTEYDKVKCTPEPKEIGGSSVLHGNPNLIKPIPVKPNTQDSEGAEPKSLSLATLFGSQHQHHHSSKTATATGEPGSAAGKGSRPPVARTLTYDDTLINSGRSVHRLDGGSRAVTGEDDHHHHYQQQQQQQQQQELLQHCPAIQKLMQGQRGVLQTLSESPENRLCDNGVPMDHHPHHHHHHHHQQQQQQLQQHDPIKKLFQAQLPPPPSSSSFSPAAPSFCSIPPPHPLQQHPHLTSKPLMVDSGSCSHLQVQQNQQLFFSLSKPQTDAGHNIMSLSALQKAGLSCQMPGVVSPHELLQKLQLVQQEQSLASSEAPRHCPGLAPRFLGSTQSQSACSVVGPGPNQIAATVGQKAAPQLPVISETISPHRIPATVAPNLLLSPSVFSQAKSGSGSSAVAQENCHEVPVLSRSQLQATLLHLIQTDGSFLDTIHKTYISRCANNSSTKYQ
ncbi:mRNA-decapping enzyme 1B [Solea solea]|uniref:mRNA-decapping enzyme 1B n=1 Tax=Solea solea TaxID=90069 RepID=UPI00272CAB0E|nr:mRNA-decapping enzyme 1B [Solea solea]